MVKCNAYIELFYYYIPLQYSCMYFWLVGDFLEKAVLFMYC